MIRTGCITCLECGTRCDGSNPNCQWQFVTEVWRANSDVSWRWHGTWRERRSIHIFVDFATSPDKVGPFESAFWSRTVMLACHHSPALYCIASAIGSLYEHVIKQTTSFDHKDTGALSFALQQCNRSIGFLTATDDDKPSAEIALMACVLFTCFESLHGSTMEATAHTLQGRQLLKLVEQLEKNRQTDGLIESTDVWPILGRLEVQANVLRGRDSVMTEADLKPDLPDVKHLYSLEHANRTLQEIYVKLLVFVQDWYLVENEYDLAHLMDYKRLVIGARLKEWQQSFERLMLQVGNETLSLDVQKARILQLNHIAASMMANSDQRGDRNVWDVYEEDFRAIVSLSASVLNTYQLDVDPPLAAVQFPFLPYGLWVAEPLFLTMSRCSDPEIRRAAAGLLFGQRWRKAAKKRGSRNMSPASINQATAVCREEDEWTLDQWIDFAMRTRVDAAEAIFFGGFAVDAIDRPVFDAHCA